MSHKMSVAHVHREPTKMIAAVDTTLREMMSAKGPSLFKLTYIHVYVFGD